MRAGQDDIDASSAPLMDHLIELRRRLIWSLLAFFGAFVLCYIFSAHIFDILAQPYLRAARWRHLDMGPAGFNYTSPLGAFSTYLQIAAFGGMFLSFPVAATQLYKFVAPGLYKNERSAFLPFLIASPVLFFLGALLVYFVAMPMLMWFSLGFVRVAASPDEVSVNFLNVMTEYLSTIMALILAFGLVFQMPVVTSLMVRAGMITSDSLKGKRKWAIVLAFVVAAVLTPPDPTSQIALAVPGVLLYEVSIIAARMIERKRAEEPGDSEAASDR
ncbi:twin-arginine translocase subunit TatC [Aureimonas leprariae]|uniref:Sec-independent protein translocase protein TatC n=1 Tax=Plantimonas leprariae TaxID=2615207 RepID=A0A7V7TXQ6_9HYPH|nr:twin-arginine translocase subunit TatC [Aureimonas leprariae]KAB0681984.1 twin-arginine translocase subunit TatC [Aureimonas leprariae]